MHSVCTTTDSALYSFTEKNTLGFRSMELGRTLWLIIAIKLFVIFVVLKLFFFPNFISRHAEKGGEADFVATQLCPEESAPDE